MILLRAVRIKLSTGHQHYKDSPLKKCFFFFPKKQPQGMSSVTRLLVAWVEQWHCTFFSQTVQGLKHRATEQLCQLEDVCINTFFSDWQKHLLPLQYAWVQSAWIVFYKLHVATWYSSGCMEMEPESLVREGGGIPDSKHSTSGKYILLMSLWFLGDWLFFLLHICFVRLIGQIRG